MSYLYVITRRFLYNLINLTPRWVFLIIFYLINIFFKDKKKLKFNNQYLGGKKNLIFLDYDNAIGDFIVLLRTIYQIDKEGYINDLIVNIKFKGILEKLNLKNTAVFYKKANFGTHYKKNDEKFMNIYNESLNKNFSYDCIYYFNKSLKTDAMLYLMNIKYNKLICMKDIYRVGNDNALWMQTKSFFLSSFFFLNKKKLKIEYRGSKQEHKNLFLADYAYYIFTKRIPKKSLAFMNFSDKFDTMKKNKNSVCIILDNNPRGRSLKLDKLIYLINNYYHNMEIVLVGDSINQSHYLENNLSNKIDNKILKTDKIIDLINVVSSCEYVLSYDTCLLHIAKILNKEIKLIVNKNKDVFMYEYNV